jgi:hypothetical protein
VAPSLQGRAFRQKSGRARSVARGACWELHPSSPSGSRQIVHPCAAHFVEQWVARRVVLPMQRR